VTWAEATQALLELAMAKLAEAGADAAADVALENEPFDPQPGQRWWRVSLAHDRAEQRTLGPVGSRRHDFWGTMHVRAYSTIGGGTVPTAGLIDLFLPLAGSVVSGSLRLGVPRVSEGERDGAFFFSTVLVPFNYEGVY
jgi:hypothetical protein